MGFKAAGAACGLKISGDLDLCILAAEDRCAAAATFTTNAFHAAPVMVTMEHLEEDGFLQAVVVNSGNANAWTGEQGMQDARDMAERTARGNRYRSPGRGRGLHRGDRPLPGDGQGRRTG